MTYIRNMRAFYGWQLGISPCNFIILFSPQTTRTSSVKVSRNLSCFPD
jgi:hypothetical protein